MNDELSLRQLFKELILFFINFKTVIVSITLIGLFAGFLYINFEEKSYELSAIATSGISEFERILFSLFVLTSLVFRSCL